LRDLRRSKGSMRSISSKGLGFSSADTIISSILKGNKVGSVLTFPTRLILSMSSKGWEFSKHLMLLTS